MRKEHGPRPDVPPQKHVYLLRVLARRGRHVRFHRRSQTPQTSPPIQKPLDAAFEMRIEQEAVGGVVVGLEAVVDAGAGGEGGGEEGVVREDEGRGRGGAVVLAVGGNVPRGRDEGDAVEDERARGVLRGGGGESGGGGGTVVRSRRVDGRGFVKRSRFGRGDIPGSGSGGGTRSGGTRSGGGGGRILRLGQRLGVDRIVDLADRHAPPIFALGMERIRRLRGQLAPSSRNTVGIANATVSVAVIVAILAMLRQTTARRADVAVAIALSALLRLRLRRTIETTTAAPLSNLLRLESVRHGRTFRSHGRIGFPTVVVVEVAAVGVGDAAAAAVTATGTGTGTGTAVMRTAKGGG
mmetsp:Transcript_5379/g.11919  ORF Transcript_5379/g.11919 Transcript_5379/m.11919 type:complete len:353 (-) Transcript_5379:266-1324(-)